MINSVYGKTMEKLRKRINDRLTDNAKDYVKCVSKPTFVSQKIFSENLVAIHKIKSVLVLNKPIYVGFSILGLVFRIYFKNKFNSRLLFTDTDSLVYESKEEDEIYEKIYSDRDLFDFSDYLKNSENSENSIKLYSKFYDVTDKKVIGKMKDELSGKVISEFIGLK